MTVMMVEMRFKQAEQILYIEVDCYGMPGNGFFHIPGRKALKEFTKRSPRFLPAMEKISDFRLAVRFHIRVRNVYRHVIVQHVEDHIQHFSGFSGCRSCGFISRDIFIGPF
jgi:hypothetical protein